VKLLDKLKDLFMDEVAEEDEFELEEEEKKEYKEPPKKDVLPKVMRDTIKKEEKKELDINTDDLLGGIKINNNAVNFDNENKKEVVNREPVKKFSFPIDIESEIPSRNSRKNNVNVLNVEKETPKKVSELYAKKEETWVKPKFKATPVISPVYGILDKNYKKEDIVSKHDIPASTNIEELTVDSVRNKAYGSLEDELENTLFGQNSILFNDKVNQEKENEEDDYLEDDFFSELEKEVQPNIDEIKNVELEEEKDRLRELEEITMDITRELDSLINKKEKQQEAKYEPKHSDEPEEDEEDDLFDLIDSMYEGEDE